MGVYATLSIHMGTHTSNSNYGGSIKRHDEQEWTEGIGVPPLEFLFFLGCHLWRSVEDSVFLQREIDGCGSRGDILTLMLIEHVAKVSWRLHSPYDLKGYQRRGSICILGF